MSKFKELFEKYGYTVEPVGKSYIAYNDVFCIPFTEVGRSNFPEISAISFLSCDKDAILKYYAEEEYIGSKVFSDWMNRLLPFTPFGSICNHDHSLYEIESWLQSRNKKSKEDRKMETWMKYTVGDKVRYTHIGQMGIVKEVNELCQIYTIDIDGVDYTVTEDELN